MDREGDVQLAWQRFDQGIGDLPGGGPGRFAGSGGIDGENETRARRYAGFGGRFGMPDRGGKRGGR